MKTIITTIALAFFMVTVNNAQIKKPSVTVNTKTVNKSNLVEGLRVSDLSRLKTVEDFEKIEIPVQQLTKEILNKKPTQSWQLTPMHLLDGNLKLASFYGAINPDNFYFYGTDANYFKVLENNNSLSGLSGHYAFPLNLEFRAIGGVEYRLKVKDLQAGNSNDKIYILKLNKGTYYLVSLSPDQNNEYNYVFKEDTSATIHIQISSKIRESERYNKPFYSWMSSLLSEIRIDRIN